MGIFRKTNSKTQQKAFRQGKAVSARDAEAYAQTVKRRQDFAAKKRAAKRRSR